MFSCIIAFITVFRERNGKDVTFYISPTKYSEKAWTVHRGRLKMILKRREKPD